jgi:hypothetical protein
MSDAIGPPSRPSLHRRGTGPDHWSGGREKAAGRCRTHPSRARGNMSPRGAPQHYRLSTSPGRSSPGEWRTSCPISGINRKVIDAGSVAQTWPRSSTSCSVTSSQHGPPTAGRCAIARPISAAYAPFWGLAVRARVCGSEPVATFEVGATLHRACIAGPAFRGTCPTQALEAQGAIGSSRKVGPVRPLYTADRLMDALRDTGCRFRRSRTPEPVLRAHASNRKARYRFNLLILLRSGANNSLP